jgi:UDP-sugar transporter A1/2/3
MPLSDLFSLKYGALVMLIAQNTFLVLLMRISRTAGGDKYLSSTAVVNMEALKLLTCAAIIQWGMWTRSRDERDQRSASSASTASASSSAGSKLDAWADILNPTEILKLCVPSCLYVVQNNLLYYALSHLDAATYLVVYQLKILTTAVFSTLLLDRALSRLQWVSLVLLTLGVSLAQLHASNSHAAKAASELTDHPLEGQNSLMGFAAVFVAACTSGFAGIYFEKVVKTTPTSLWARNVQLGLSSMVFAVVGVYMNDGAVVAKKGFFFGYTPLVVAVVFLQAVGGLVVAVVVKYADNILKGFAASLSIITSCVVSYVFLDFEPSVPFVLGAMLVLGSSYIYEKGLPPFLGLLAHEHIPWLLVKPSPGSGGGGGSGAGASLAGEAARAIDMASDMLAAKKNDHKV